MASITLKFKHGKEIRRLTVEQPLTYATVTQLMGQLFPDLTSFTLKYEDPDGDKITVSSEGEIQEAISVALGTNNVLRFFVSEKSSETNKQPEVATTPSSSSSVPVPVVSNPSPSPVPAPSVNPTPTQSVPAIHFGVTCDGCQTSPIHGIRYKCFVCSDFDLCSNCEATKTHDQTHPLIQIAQPHTFGGRGFGGGRGGRRHFHGPEGAPAFPFHHWRAHPHPHAPMMNPNIVNPIPVNPAFEGMNANVNAPQIPSVPVPGVCLRRLARGKGLARFVQDVTIEDGTVLKPNEPFLKVWRIRNSGETAWPEGTVLLFVGGDLLGALTQVPVPRTVQAGEEVDIAVNMVAPEKSGRYTGYWRLMCPEGRFGQRVWVDVFVNLEKPAEPNLVDEFPAGVSLADPPLVPTPVNNHNNANNNVAIPVQPTAVPLAVPVPIPVFSPVVQVPIAPPPELLTEDEVKSLALLRDMGFSGSLLEVLRQNNGDLMATIRVLLNN